MIWLDIKEFAAKENSLPSSRIYKHYRTRLIKRMKAGKDIPQKRTVIKGPKPTYEDLAFEGVPKKVGKQIIGCVMDLKHEVIRVV